MDARPVIPLSFRQASVWPSPRQTPGPSCPYPSNRTPPEANMKCVDATSAWSIHSDFDKKESGGRDPPQGVAPHAHGGVVGAHGLYLTTHTQATPRVLRCRTADLKPPIRGRIGAYRGRTEPYRGVSSPTGPNRAAYRQQRQTNCQITLHSSYSQGCHTRHKLFVFLHIQNIEFRFSFRSYHFIESIDTFLNFCISSNLECGFSMEEG